MRLPGLTLAVAAFLALPAVQAEEKTITPRELKTITTQELLTKLAVPADKRDFTLVDARTAVEFAEAHVPGAVAMPANSVLAALPKLVKSKDRLIIFYCNGPNCTKSTKAAMAAMGIGYTNVIEYKEGLPGWGMAGQKTEGNPLPAFQTPTVAATDIKALMAAKGGPPMIDIRDADEYAKSHIAGAINVPLDEIAQTAEKLAPGKSAIIVDHAGHQTLVAGRLLRSLGRTELKRLDGGMLKWQEAGFPVVSR